MEIRGVPDMSVARLSLFRDLSATLRGRGELCTLVGEKESRSPTRTSKDLACVDLTSAFFALTCPPCPLSPHLPCFLNHPSPTRRGIYVVRHSPAQRYWRRGNSVIVEPDTEPCSKTGSTPNYPPPCSRILERYVPNNRACNVSYMGGRLRGWERPGGQSATYNFRAEYMRQGQRGVYLIHAYNLRRETLPSQQTKEKRKIHTGKK